MKDEVFARVVQGAQEAVEINRLRAERDALKKDAERYRGLLREAYGCLSDEDDALAQRIKKALRGEGE